MDFLIIDDDLKFGTTLKMTLESKKFAVTHVSTIEAALKELKTNVFTNIILDLKLDFENGLELLSHKDLISQSKVVVLSGYGSVTSTKYALKNGAFNFIQKPASLDEILKAFEDSDSPSPIPLSVPSLDEVEREHIERVLKEHGGNITRSAKALGLHRRSLQRKISTNPHYND